MSVGSSFTAISAPLITLVAENTSPREEERCVKSLQIDPTISHAPKDPEPIFFLSLYFPQTLTRPTGRSLIYDKDGGKCGCDVMMREL